MELSVCLITHCLATAVFYICNRRRTSWIKNWAETAIVFFVPLFGFAIMVLSKAAVRIFHVGEKVAAEELEQGEDLFTSTRLAADIIPLNDAFLVQDVQRKRGFFTEAIKQSVVENEQILQMAMHDKDREIAYYAVSMLTSRMEEMEARLFAQEQQLAAAGAQQKLAAQKEYASLLKSYLSHKGFIDHVTYRNKQKAYIELLRELLAKEPETRRYYTEAIENLMDIGHYKEAEEMCASFQQHFPKQETAYMMYIKLYQTWKRPAEMQRKLQELKACPVELSEAALQAIRFWDRKVVWHG